MRHGACRRSASLIFPASFVISTSTKVNIIIHTLEIACGSSSIYIYIYIFLPDLLRLHGSWICCATGVLCLVNDDFGADLFILILISTNFKVRTFLVLRLLRGEKYQMHVLIVSDDVCGKRANSMVRDSHG